MSVHENVKYPCKQFSSNFTQKVRGEIKIINYQKFWCQKWKISFLCKFAMVNDSHWECHEDQDWNWKSPKMHVIRLRSNMKAKAKTIKGSHGLFLGLENIM